MRARHANNTITVWRPEQQHVIPEGEATPLPTRCWVVDPSGPLRDFKPSNTPVLGVTGQLVPVNEGASPVEWEEALAALGMPPGTVTTCRDDAWDEVTRAKRLTDGVPAYVTKALLLRPG